MLEVELSRRPGIMIEFLSGEVGADVDAVVADVDAIGVEGLDMTGAAIVGDVGRDNISPEVVYKYSSNK